MSQLSQSIGRCISHVIEPDGLYLHAENADVRIRVWSANIIQIHISIQEEAESFSYAVDGKPAKTKFKIEESKGEFQLSTSEIILRIKKSRIRFSFFDKRNNILNSDDPAFGTSWINSELTTYKSLQEGERFVGLGEKAKNLDRRGEAFVNWNTDAFGYGSWTDPLYASTPFFIGLHNDRCYGIFLNNSHRSKFNFGASNHRFASFSVDGGDMNYFFIHHKKVEDIVKSYVSLTGTMPLPPKWSLGYQQCRYSYYPQEEVEEIAATFREKQIPCDVIYFDIHYMYKYMLFTWDKERFPEPSKLIARLKKMGFKVVVIVDPGIKIDENYEVYQNGILKDVFVKYPDGSNYSANVWPGKCNFPDFTKAEVREWWQEELKVLADCGLEGFWNDMNEPSSWGQDTPDNIEFNYEGHPTTHKKARNVYGMQMARATYDGARKHLKNKRPFILSRSGFSGVQRYAAIWTGDNTASDESMMLGARIVSNLGLAGIPFAGFDVGGFLGDASSGLYQRWIALGAFSPFFRGHTMINSKRSEPWSYGEETEEIARNYISLRYRMMPYIYSIFYRASCDGTPIARSLVLDYSFDEMIYRHEFQDQYMFGPSLMICPTESGKQFRKIYLPKGQWFDLYNDKKFSGGKEHVIELASHRFPVYVRSSAIIPMQSQTQSLAEHPDPTLCIHVYNGRNSNSFELYEDDGGSYGYQKKDYAKKTITLDPSKRTLQFSRTEGSFKSEFDKYRIYFHGFSKIRSLRLNGKILKQQKEEYRFIEAVSNFDPFYRHVDESIRIEELSYVEFKNLKREVELKF
ncbi:MAG: glycoside hydrolase family 31 protein [Chitinophagales bacterium]|nr:glycoside hydrolase family 31 protein [Chitinophagales bacterium]